MVFHDKNGVRPYAVLHGNTYGGNIMHHHGIAEGGSALSAMALVELKMPGEVCPCCDTMQGGTSHFTTRPFTLADYDAVTHVWEQAGLPWSPSDTPTELAKFLCEDEELFLVAVDQDTGQVVGTVLAGWDGRQGFLYHLGVLPAMQRQGVGALLLTTAEDLLRKRGAIKVNLLVRAYNSKALAFYKSLGYAVDEGLLVMSHRLNE